LLGCDGRITAVRAVLELAELALSNIFDFIEVHADGSVQIDLLRATRDRAAAIHDVVVRRGAEGSGNEGSSVKLKGFGDRAEVVLPIGRQPSEADKGLERAALDGSHERDLKSTRPARPHLRLPPG
jgi:hypothetical protein